MSVTENYLRTIVLVELRLQEGCGTLVISGEVDASNHDDFAHQLDEVLRELGEAVEVVKEVRLDASALTFIDVGGARILTRFERALRQRRCRPTRLPECHNALLVVLANTGWNIFPAS